ncbi:unnamed protein product [Thelazia callipaeda]|uniref:DB domain-containing protein n=1 Tax=Thelazia callipaeda TaxID=103827 RepID=A0A0N5CU60_THECL|nr:unnamed protein product [Thelazia callipaeda]
MNSGLLNTILLYISIDVSKACVSSGICTGGYGCETNVAPTCVGGCAFGYTCGQYGCYSKARARSSKTFAFHPQTNEHFYDTKQEGLTSEQLADEMFHDCCLDQHLPDSCLQKCSFKTYTKNNLQAIYLHLDDCPLKAIAAITYCAARGIDHTPCCIENGVARTIAGSKCLVLCDQRSGNVTELNLSYLPCFERFNDIKSCFMEYSNSKYQSVNTDAMPVVQRFGS